MPWFRSSKKSAQVADATAPPLLSNNYPNGKISLNSGQVGPHTVTAVAQRVPLSSTPIPLPVYRPLPTDNEVIRLLEVTPGAAHEPIRCYTHYISLSAKDLMPYETVSYCWGQTQRDFDIMLDRVPARIQGSAGRLLQRLRASGKRRVIWIDAVCINQDDVEEKSRQVAMMGDIYRCGWRNVVWLGDSPRPEDENAVYCAIRNVQSDMRRHVGSDDDLFDFTHKDPTTSSSRFYRTGKLLDQNIDLKPLVALFSSKWFGRMWVIQEVALAKTNLCHYGSITLHLADVLKAAVWLLWNGRVLHPSELVTSPGLGHAFNIWYLADHKAVPKEVPNRSNHSLAQLSTMVKDYKATEPKDKVYALLGMCNLSRSQYMPFLQPRYGKDVSVSEVYRDATRVMVAESRSLRILQFCSPAANQMLDRPTPSWVVSLEHMGSGNITPHHLNLDFDTHHGQMAQPCTQAAAKDPNVLTLAGFKLDSVAQWIGPFSDDSTRPDSATLTKVLALTEQVSKRFPWRNMFAELAETLTGGRDWIGNISTPMQTKEFTAFMEHFRRENPPTLPKSSPDREAAAKSAYRARQFYRAMSPVCVGRTFFVTTGGLIGLGPANLSKDTTIAVLYGGTVPFALHPVKGSKDKVTLLGECFVINCMYGEIMSRHKAKGARDEIYQVV